MNLTQLKTFIWLSILKNFRKTAEHMSTTQPSISARIAALETHLGVRLFDRKNNEVTLTAKGHELMVYAEKIVGLVDQAEFSVGKSQEMAGLIRLGVSESIVHSWLPTFLSEMFKLHPNLEIDITVDVTENLRSDLFERKLDLAFLLGPISDYRMKNISLGSFPLIWVCKTGMLEPKKTNYKLEDFSEYPIISFARNTRPFEEIQSAFMSQVTKPIKLFPCSALSSMQKMMENGIGIANLPEFLIKNSSEGDLQILNCDWHPSSLNYSAAYPTKPYNKNIEYVAEFAQTMARGYLD